MKKHLFITVLALSLAGCGGRCFPTCIHREHNRTDTEYTIRCLDCKKIFYREIDTRTHRAKEE